MKYRSFGAFIVTLITAAGCGVSPKIDSKVAASSASSDQNESLGASSHVQEYFCDANDGSAWVRLTISKADNASKISYGKFDSPLFEVSLPNETITSSLGGGIIVNNGPNNLEGPWVYMSMSGQPIEGTELYRGTVIELVRKNENGSYEGIDDYTPVTCKRLGQG